MILKLIIMNVIFFQKKPTARVTDRFCQHPPPVSVQVSRKQTDFKISDHARIFPQNEKKIHKCELGGN